MMRASLSLGKDLSVTWLPFVTNGRRSCGRHNIGICTSSSTVLPRIADKEES